MDKSKVQVVILCGGKGTRIREISELVPKPLIPIGEMPIIWHIMKGYSVQGYKNFILCLGYKGETIRNFFLDYVNNNQDISLNLKSGEINYRNGETEDWNVTLVNTGLETNTGKRLHAVKKYLENEPYFLLTYGDGVSDVNIDELINFHKSKLVVGTITGIRASSKYGQVKSDENGIISQFAQYPLLDDRINGGFMVLNKEFLDYSKLATNESIEEAIIYFTHQRKMAVYNHEGYWHCMDTPRDFEKLNKMWDSGKAGWKTW